MGAIQDLDATLAVSGVVSARLRRRGRHDGSHAPREGARVREQSRSTSNAPQGLRSVAGRACSARSAIVVARVAAAMVVTSVVNQADLQSVMVVSLLQGEGGAFCHSLFAGGCGHAPNFVDRLTRHERRASGSNTFVYRGAVLRVALKRLAARLKKGVVARVAVRRHSAQGLHLCEACAAPGWARRRNGETLRSRRRGCSIECAIRLR